MDGVIFPQGWTFKDFYDEIRYDQTGASLYIEVTPEFLEEWNSNLDDRGYSTEQQNEEFFTAAFGGAPSEFLDEDVYLDEVELREAYDFEYDAQSVHDGYIPMMALIDFGYHL